MFRRMCLSPFGIYLLVEMVDCGGHVLSVGRNIERGMRRRREKGEAGRGIESRTIEMITGAFWV